MSFKGYAIHDTAKWDQFKVIDFESKTFGDDDVEIKIEYCGVCGSDVHTITGGWGEPMLPLITGHEVAGTVTKVGKNVKSIKVGQRAGLGAQVCSCFKCTPCNTDNENYCPNGVDTYNAKYPNGDIAHGGYSNGIRVHERFCFPIPDALENKYAAPMLCGGLTVFSPLVRNGCGPGKKVGVIGLGGLGHFAVMFAKALGAEVTVFSHSDNKKEDALKMGASHFVIADDDGKFAEPLAMTLDIIINTRDVAEGFPLAEYVSTLNVHGRMIMVAMPDDKLPPFATQSLAGNGAFIGGSHIGNKKEALQMLQLAADKGVRTWIEELPMSECSKAVRGVKDNKVRYRYVLKCDL